MTTDKELMQQALDALSMAVEPKKGKVYAFEFQPIDCDAMYLKAIEALRARLEKWTVKDTAHRPGGLPQSEQELVAWARVNMNDHKEGDLGIGATPYAAQAAMVAGQTQGRMYVDPVTGDVGIGNPNQVTLDTSGATGFKLDASAPLVVHPHPAFQATPPQQHSEQWWQHEVSNAWAEGYEKGRVFCGCGDQIMPDDGAECGNCVTARNAVKPDLAQVGEVGVWGEREWQGLTDEEYRTLLQQADYDAAETGSVFQNLRHAIETKLKEKNT